MENCKLQTENCKLQTEDCKLQTENCKLAERDMFIELEDAKQVEAGDIETQTFVSKLPAKEWLSTVDFALAAGISDQQVRRLINSGRLIARFKGTGKDGRSEYQIARARAIRYFKETLGVF